VTSRVLSGTWRGASALQWNSYALILDRMGPSNFSAKAIFVESAWAHIGSSTRSMTVNAVQLCSGSNIAATLIAELLFSSIAAHGTMIGLWLHQLNHLNHPLRCRSSSK
jgi:hypothetical protein